MLTEFEHDYLIEDLTHTSYVTRYVRTLVMKPKYLMGYRIEFFDDNDSAPGLEIVTGHFFKSVEKIKREWRINVVK